MDLKRLSALTRQLRVLATDVETFSRAPVHKKRGHFIASEHDQIESLLFRYMACRRSLWDLITYYERSMAEAKTSSIRAQQFIIAFSAAANLYYHSSYLVKAFLDDPEVIAKLNESYHRSGIPANSYETVFRSVTSIDNIERFRAARVLFEQEAATPGSPLMQVVKAEPAYAKLAAGVSDLGRRADATTEAILEERSLLLPSVRNRLRHSSIASIARAMKLRLGDGLAAARAVLFVNISRLHAPTATLISFSKRQLRQMRSLLKPGDLVMTFSAGYMSNVFLPGAFKHGITYVGLPAQRKAAGLTPGSLSRFPAERRLEVARHLETDTVALGRKADLVEAVAEGVIFNSLETITDAHISRLLVLRPRLVPAETRRQLATVFSLVGDNYDFAFDFDSGSAQCCTEVIYRALHGVGPISFALTKRAGVQTLSADDIIDYHLSAKDRFDFVLLAEEKSRSGRAMILTGERGEQRLRELMASVQ